jgi:hypothetical protein
LSLVRPDCAAETLTVRNAPELYAALAVAKRGQGIHAIRGDYSLDRALVVPDGVALIGDGEMQIDAAGNPQGWAVDATTLRVSGRLLADVVTLGDGAALEGLRIVQFANASAPQAAQPQSALLEAPTWNVVAIVSRGPADSVAATIRDCEIVNPNPFSVESFGPGGRAIVVVTRHAAPPLVAETHLGAHLSVTIERSIVRSGDSNSLFAANFAPRARIDIVLRDNRLEGLLSASGGVSRLALVSDATTTIESRHNLYTQTGSRHGLGWQLLGGSSAPHAVTATPGAFRNTLRVRSLDDRIEGSYVAVSAAAGRRVLDTSGLVSDNRLELDMTGTTLRTIEAAGADLSLHGALVEALPGEATRMAVGDGNELRVRITGARGSGPRANVFSNVTGPVLPSQRGHGNRVIFSGDAVQFARSNPGIEPVPACECWERAESP